MNPTCACVGLLLQFYLRHIEDAEGEDILPKKMLTSPNKVDGTIALKKRKKVMSPPIFISTFLTEL
jgi:hypothetical protein